MLERLKGLGFALGLYLLINLAQLGIFIPTWVGSSHLLVQGLVLIYMVGIVVLIAWIGRRLGLIGESWAPIRQHLGKIFLGYGVVWLLNLLGSLLLQLQGMTTTGNQEVLNQVFSRIPLSQTFVLVVLLAPLAEELICRGIIPRLLFKGYEKWGYLVGWLVFALLHKPTNVGSWVIYGGMSTVLTYLAYKTQRLEVSIALHFLINLVAISLSLLLSLLVNM